MPRTLVVVPARWPGVLPAAVAPALLAATVLGADSTVPDEVLAATGACRRDGWSPDGHPGHEVLLSADPDSTLVERADQVVTVAEPPGATLLDAVAVMDRLRSPGGCPWDAEQTPASLLPYLVEECYELHQAVEDADRDAVREELGDVLLQVLFHARLAEDGVAPFGTDAFGIDEVAAGLVAKLVGRHPHVFGDTDKGDTEKLDTAERQQRRWEELKRAEKQRESSVDGVPRGQPAVALAAKLASRAGRAGLPVDLLPGGSRVGEQLFALAARAKLAGVDPESELRATARRFAEDVRAAERAAVEAGDDPHALDAEAWRQHWPR